MGDTYTLEHMGYAVTVRKLKNRDASIRSRFYRALWEHYSKDSSNELWDFAHSMTAVISLEGTEWELPHEDDNAEDIVAKYEQWLNEDIQLGEAVSLAVAELYKPADPDLAPGLKDEADPKGGKSA